MVKKICMITGTGFFIGAAVCGVLAFAAGSLMMITYITLAVSFAIAGAVTMATGMFIGNIGGDTKLLQTGTPATAVIMSVQETGMVVNYTNQVLNLGLRVQVGSEPPYDVIVKQMVPMLFIARCMPGSTVGVRVDPQNREKVMVDFSVMPGVAPTAQAFTPPPAPAPPGVVTPPTAPQPQPPTSF